MDESKCMTSRVSHQVHRAPRAANQFPQLARECPWELRERNTEASAAQPAGRGRGSYRLTLPEGPPSRSPSWLLLCQPLKSCPHRFQPRGVGVWLDRDEKARSVGSDAQRDLQHPRGRSTGQPQGTGRTAGCWPGAGAHSSWGAAGREAHPRQLIPAPVPAGPPLGAHQQCTLLRPPVSEPHAPHVGPGSRLGRCLWSPRALHHRPPCISCFQGALHHHGQVGHQHQGRRELAEPGAERVHPHPLRCHHRGLHQGMGEGLTGRRGASPGITLISEPHTHSAPAGPGAACMWVSVWVSPCG